MTLDAKRIEAYTDGACRGNPGEGGWGALIKYELFSIKMWGKAEGITTNNRMELTAAIEALRDCHKSSKDEGVNISLFTDSMYVKNGITMWIKRWKKNGWRTSDRKEVKNVDLWKKLDLLCEELNVEWNWVKGHDINEGNIEADKLANMAMNLDY